MFAKVLSQTWRAIQLRVAVYTGDMIARVTRGKVH